MDYSPRDEGDVGHWDFPPGMPRAASDKIEPKKKSCPSRWLKEFEALPIADAVRPKILFENAKRLLKLSHLTYG